jgi:hypothetical protein
MTFRLNELDSAMSMAYLLERGHIRHARGPLDGEERRRPIFVLYHEKCFFHFWRTEIGFFVKQLPKREINSWEKHPT